ncbi:MAG TPA: MFS transporter [Pseudonocardia sp.]|jgi:AAHS family 4-hydroxybenzoate transporter-like MFS transporter|nr:MFS transporter [Pseudonocardia sp.]
MSAEATPTVQGPPRVRWHIVALAFLAVLLDGFDAASLSVVVPTLAKQWGTAPASFTAPLVLTNIGVVLGYLSCGWLGARFGRRPMLIAGVVLFAVLTGATALVLSAESITALSVLRFGTGLGLGMALPLSVALATDYSPDRRRELVAVIVTLGLTSGSTVGGLVGGRLLVGIGAAGIFWVAAVLPLLLAGVLLLAMPEPARRQTGAAAKHDAKLARLFAPELRATTTMLWAFAFLVFIAAYTLTSWVPTLLVGYGFSPTRAPIGLAYVSFGGLLGGLALIPLAARLGITRTLILLPTLGAICMVIAARVQLSDGALLLVLGGAGAGVVAAQIGQLTLAVSLYSAGSRTTGVGWAAALGRAGSIVGPGVAGILIGLALAGKDIVLLTAVPVVVAAACATAIWWVRRTRTPSAAAAEVRVPR